LIRISHRGNVSGRNEKRENTIGYIREAALLGYDVEIDVWWDNGFWLGHDDPSQAISLDFLEHGPWWIHCKNMQALARLSATRLRYFWHEEDRYTITSNGYVWAYPGMPIDDIAGCNAILVVKDQGPNVHPLLIGYSGVCSDYIKNYD